MNTPLLPNFMLFQLQNQDITVERKLIPTNPIDGAKGQGLCMRFEPTYLNAVKYFYTRIQHDFPLSNKNSAIHIV
jgi:hypothetical protein